MNRPVVLASVEQRCRRGSEGIVYAATRWRVGTTLLARLNLRVLTRVEPGDVKPSDVPLVDGNCQVAGVEVREHESAVTGVLRLAAVAWKESRDADGVLATQPGLVGAAAAAVAWARRLPLVVVVVGDPAESLSPDVMRGWRGRVGRVILSWTQRQACRHADVVRYVSSVTLPDRYPAGTSASVHVLSNVEILELGYARVLPPGPWTFFTVGSMVVPYTGIADLIDAVALVREKGFDVRLRVVGDGRLLPELRERGERILGRWASFVGAVAPGEPVREELRAADLFVLASWTEGLPRALVEAQSVGLPAVGTRVGGIPELVPEDALCPARDPSALAVRIAALLSDPTRYRLHSEHSISSASHYHVERLRTLEARFDADVLTALRQSRKLSRKEVHL